MVGTLFASTNATSNFAALVPNGFNIPSLNATKSPDHNVFVQDFDNAGHEWTKDLCERDSDNDGQSNGLELGDPCCGWTVGGTPVWTIGISNPGDATSISDPSRLAAISCMASSGFNEAANCEVS